MQHQKAARVDGAGRERQHQAEGEVGAGVRWRLVRWIRLRMVLRHPVSRSPCAPTSLCAAGATRCQGRSSSQAMRMRCASRPICGCRGSGRPGHAGHAVAQGLLGGGSQRLHPGLPLGAGGGQGVGSVQDPGRGMGKAQRIPRMAQRQRQGGGGVVFKVDVADHAIRAAHQVAGKGLAQAGAGPVDGERLQPVPARWRCHRHGLFHLVAQAGVCSRRGRPGGASESRLRRRPAPGTRRPRAARSRRRATSVAIATPARVGNGVSTGTRRPRHGPRKR
jgi:hypothetical protein